MDLEFWILFFLISVTEMEWKFWILFLLMAIIKLNWNYNFLILTSVTELELEFCILFWLMPTIEVKLECLILFLLYCCSIFYYETVYLNVYVCIWHVGLGVYRMMHTARDLPSWEH
jgi:hypothetical protein